MNCNGIKQLPPIFWPNAVYHFYQQRYADGRVLVLWCVHAALATECVNASIENIELPTQSVPVPSHVMSLATTISRSSHPIPACVNAPLWYFWLAPLHRAETENAIELLISVHTFFCYFQVICTREELCFMGDWQLHITSLSVVHCIHIDALVSSLLIFISNDEIRNWKWTYCSTAAVWRL